MHPGLCWFAEQWQKKKSATQEEHTKHARFMSHEGTETSSSKKHWLEADPTTGCGHDIGLTHQKPRLSLPATIAFPAGRPPSAGNLPTSDPPSSLYFGYLSTYLPLQMIDSLTLGT